MNQELISILYAWLIENSLFLNKKKTEFIIFGTSARLSTIRNLNVKIREPNLTCFQFQYLGVMLDEALNCMEIPS